MPSFAGPLSKPTGTFSKCPEQGFWKLKSSLWVFMSVLTQQMGCVVPPANLLCALSQSSPDLLESLGSNKLCVVPRSTCHVLEMLFSIRVWHSYGFWYERISEYIRVKKITRMNIRIYLYEIFWHEGISEYIHIKILIRTNIRINIWIKNIWIFEYICQTLDYTSTSFVLLQSK